MKNKIKLVLVLVMISTLMISCNLGATDNGQNGNGEELTEINIASLKGPTTMGMVKLIDDSKEDSIYNFNIYGTGDEVVSLLINEEIDIALLPCNLASVIYNSTEGDIQVAAINTLGVIYIVESGDTVQTIEDLRGKKIYSVGKGTTPEFALNYILGRNNIELNKDIEIEYKSEATELAILLEEEDNLIGVLPQPYVTIVQMQNEKVRVALDLTKEWDKVSTDSSMVTGVLIVRTKFAEDNKEAFDKFLSLYEDSTEYVNQNHKEAALLIKEYGIVANEVIAEKSIPESNITYIAGEEMKMKVSGYLQVLYDQNPQAVGGMMPKDDFYYQAEE